MANTVVLNDQELELVRKHRKKSSEIEKLILAGKSTKTAVLKDDLYDSLDLFSLADAFADNEQYTSGAEVRATISSLTKLKPLAKKGDILYGFPVSNYHGEVYVEWSTTKTRPKDYCTRKDNQQMQDDEVNHLLKQIKNIK